MGRPKKINIVPFKEIEIEILPREDDGKYPYRRWRYSLSEITNKLQELNIPQSEWNKIEICSCTFDRSNDPYLLISYRKDKTKEEIAAEQKIVEQKLLQQEQDKIARKAAREKKKADKAEALAKLDPALKRILGLK